MPDAGQLDLGAPTSGGGKGVPQWLMVVGAVAGIAGVVLLLRSGSGSGGTTAAGTSINAALGSIQEENMNLLGTTQAGIMQTNTNIGNATTFLSNQAQSNYQGLITQGATNYQGIISNANTNYTNLSTQMANSYSSLTQQQSDALASITGQISAFQNQQTGLLGDLTNQIASGQNLSTAQYNELVNIQTNPWVKQLYENNIVSTLAPQQQGYYWNAVESMASQGHLQGANAGTY